MTQMMMKKPEDRWLEISPYRWLKGTIARICVLLVMEIIGIFYPGILFRTAPKGKSKIIKVKIWVNTADWQTIRSDKDGVSSTTPLYVVDKDLQSNILIVGPKNQLARNRLWAENVNWVSIHQPVDSFHAQVKIRYRSSEAPATVIPTGEDSAEVLFDHPIQDITPGQAAVFYEGEQCLGGGIIQRSA